MKRRKPPKNTMNIQRIQENVRELIQRNIIPCNYTVLSNALVAHIQYPRKYVCLYNTFLHQTNTYLLESTSRSN